MTKTPTFTYHPDPIGTGALKLTKSVCDSCGIAPRLGYEGPFYSVADVDMICADCISTGKAAKKFDGSYNDIWTEIDHGGEHGIQINEETLGVAPEVIDELLHRTPGYSSWQGNPWMFHCKDGCEFHGDANVSDVKEATKATVLEWERRYELSWPKVMGDFQNNGDLGVYKFKCRHCDLILFHWDFT